MKLKFDEEWLKEAIQIEDAVSGDISAGLDLGSYAGDHLARSQGIISRQKMTEILNEGLGNILGSEDIEDIIDAAQSCANEKIRIKMHADKVA